MARYQDILQTVGRTPAVRINRLGPPGVNLYAKIESFNPMGSVKDRLALGVIEDAEQRGALKPGQTVIEATSGNTGIGLAMVCAAKGYPLVVVMAESFSIERRKMMRFLGARVVLTPAAEKGTGMLHKAVELSEKHGWFLARQFENEANPDMHSKTTAREILEDFTGERLDYWVTGFGTGGTLKGVARVLKAERPDTSIIVCEPDNAAMLASAIPQAREADGGIAASHPRFRPHLMQGWSPDFIPKLTEDVVTAGHIDRLLPIDGEEALRCTKDLAQKEGIFCGVSGGATLAGALRIAAEAEKGSTILCMLPDTGERYLSTPLFFDVKEDMDEQELEISMSTPGFRFDTAPSTPAPEKSQPPEVSPEGEAYVADVLADPQPPAVMFALTWCEFCWAVRKLFGKLGVDYRSVDLDSPEMAENDLGGKIRTALWARTGAPTLPQVYVAGEHIGGCTETFEAYRDGSLQAKLTEAGVPFDAAAEFDPYALLPGWLAKR